MAKSRNAGKNNPMYGKKHSPEALAKISAAHKGKSRPPFTHEWRQSISDAHKGLLAGDKNPAWKGGRKKDRGYILIYAPAHPLADSKGYVYEHRLVMEEHIGRYLSLAERVHHVNEDVSDNRAENLTLHSTNGKHMLAEHITRDAKGRFAPKRDSDGNDTLDGVSHKEFPDEMRFVSI